MNIGERLLIMEPFGHIIEQPVCPYCGRAISVWVVQARKHMEECYMNPEVQEKIEQAAKNLKTELAKESKDA